LGGAIEAVDAAGELSVKPAVMVDVLRLQAADNNPTAIGSNTRYMTLTPAKIRAVLTFSIAPTR
jgi:hypothetical protein